MAESNRVENIRKYWTVMERCDWLRETKLRIKKMQDGHGVLRLADYNCVENIL